MMKGGKGYTVADIEALPEGERAELIDGEMFRMDTPTWTHQKIQMALSAKIWNYIAEYKGPCRVMPAPLCGVHLGRSCAVRFSERVKAGIFEELYLKLSEVGI